MSPDDERKSVSITKWQALSNHEGSVWETDYTSVRTNLIDGTPSDDVTIKRKVASYLSEIKQEEIEYTKGRAARTKVKHFFSPISQQGADEYEHFLTELGIDNLGLDTSSNNIAHMSDTSELVNAQDIDLVEVTDRSRIHVDIFPLTFRCRTCGHYQIITADSVDLSCPDCKTKGKKNGERDRDRRMIQESVVFVCPHCANIEELTPRNTKVNTARDGVFECPKGCGGHLHFYRWRSLTKAYFKCTRCGYIEQPILRNCGCSSYSADEAFDSKVWPMRLNPTSASNTYGLQKTFVEIEKKDISLASLYAKSSKDVKEGKRSWKLDQLLQGLDGFTRAMFKQTYDLSDAFLVNDIESNTVIWGYTTHISTTRPIKDDERLKKYFARRGNRYMAYLIRSTGRGLVLVFNKEKIAEVVQAGLPHQKTYNELVIDELDRLKNGVFHENLDQPERFPIVSTMHAIEHALFRKASDEAGLEVFASKILLTDGAILLFERQDVGEGGVIQLITGQQFLRLANGIYEELSTCGQGCGSGCLSCSFINDFNCSPFLETECDRWYPGNSFLNRKFGRYVIGLAKG